MKEIQQTIDDLKQELWTSPGDPELLNELGVGHHLLGDYKTAISFFRKALRESSKDPKLYFNLANSYYENQQIEKAITAYMDAIDMKPDYIPALNNLADIYETAGQPEKARDFFQYITKIKPDDPLGFVNLGNHYLRQNNIVEAGTSYKKAIALYPECYEAYNNIGFILKHLGKYEEAMKYYTQCLEIKPGFEPASRDLKECRANVER